MWGNACKLKGSSMSGCGVRATAAAVCVLRKRTLVGVGAGAQCYRYTYMCSVGGACGRAGVVG